jgi:hypothetical protein
MINFGTFTPYAQNTRVFGKAFGAFNGNTFIIPL